MDLKKFFKNAFAKKLEKGVYTKNGHFLDEIESGLKLGRSTLIFGDCEYRIRTFLGSSYLLFIQNAKSSFSILRKGLGEDLHTKLAESSKHVTFIDLGNSNAKEMIEKIHKKALIGSSHIIAVFPDDPDLHAKNFEAIQDNIEALLECLCKHAEKTVNERASKDISLNAGDSLDEASFFFFDRARFYTRHLNSSKRLPVLLAQAGSALNWKALWVVGHSSLEKFQLSDKDMDVGSDIVIEAIMANSSLPFLILERDKHALNEIDDLVSRISLIYLNGGDSFPDLESKKIVFRSDNEFLIAYSKSISEKARRKDIVTGRYRTVTINKNAGDYAILQF